jgi:hypothetical protein
MELETMTLIYGAGVVFEEAEWFGGHITEADFQLLAKYGCGIVRLHAIRLYHIMPTDGVIDQNFFANVIDKFVALAKKYKMNITIDIGDWSTGSQFGGGGFPTWMTTGFATAADFQKAFWDLTNPTCNHQRAMFLKVWQFIADRYKTEIHVGFSIYNEPLNVANKHFENNIHGLSDAAFSDYIGTQYSLFMEQLSDTIRGAGAAIQPIVVNSPFVFYLKDQKKINRANIYWDVHLYEDPQTNFAAWQRLFDERQNYFASLGMPMIMGEWGIYDWTYLKSIDYKTALTDMFNYIKSKGVEFVTWLGYGAFRTNLTAQQKDDILKIVCAIASNVITEPPVTYVLDVWTALGGTTSPTGIEAVTSGTVVTITATAGTGYKFNGWQVQIGMAQALTTYPDTVNPLTLTITAATVVMPLFNLVPATPTCATGYHWDATANACVQDAQPSQAGATIAFLLLGGGIIVGGLVLGSKGGKKRTQRRRR